MARDIEVKTRLTAEEYVALEALADHEGMSHSGMLRHLLKVRIRSFVHEQRMDAEDENRRAKPGPKRGPFGPLQSGGEDL